MAVKHRFRQKQKKRNRHIAPNTRKSKNDSYGSL